jgi:hypothetical protein
VRHEAIHRRPAPVHRDVGRCRLTLRRFQGDVKLGFQASQVLLLPPAEKAHQARLHLNHLLHPIPGFLRPTPCGAHRCLLLTRQRLKRSHGRCTKQLFRFCPSSGFHSPSQQSH